jgi:hypothetical protein
MIIRNKQQCRKFPPFCCDVPSIRCVNAPFSINVEPQGFVNAPFSINVEPPGFDVEPFSINVEPPRFNVQCFCFVNEPFCFDVESPRFSVECFCFNVDTPGFSVLCFGVLTEITSLLPGADLLFLMRTGYFEASSASVPEVCSNSLPRSSTTDCIPGAPSFSFNLATE